MDSILSIFNLNIVPLSEASLRIVLAVFFGLVIGWDRERKNKPIDFRVYMIIAVSTCAIAILGQELYSHYDKSQSVLSIDLSKIIAGVLTGIGFLGAGAIIKKNKNQVIGTATGASIWASGGIGLILGFGLYGLAFITFLAISLILMIGGLFLSEDNNQDDK